MGNMTLKYIRNAAFVTGLFLVIYALIFFGVLNRYHSTILILIMIGIIAAVSLNLSTGMLGQLVLGHAAFMGLGAYGAALLGKAIFANGWFSFIPWSGVHDLLVFIISALVGGLIAALAGIMVGTPALRLKGDYLGIMTLGFGEVVIAFISNLTSITGGAQGLKAIPRIVTFPVAYWTMVICVTLIVFIMKSRHGRAILSIRENEIAAEAVGINLTKYKVVTFSIAAFFGGISGAVLAFSQGFIAPSITSFGFVKSIEVFVIVVLGGMGSITGSIISATILTFLPEALRQFASYRLLVYSLILVFMMLYRPQGIFGTAEMSLTAAINKVKSLSKSFHKLLKKTFSRGEK